MNAPSTTRPKRVIMRLQYSEAPQPLINTHSHSTPHMEQREKAVSPNINIIQQQINIIYSKSLFPKTNPIPYIEDRQRAPSPDINIVNQQLNIINSNQWVFQNKSKSQRVIQTLRYSEPPTPSITNDNGPYLEMRENAPSPDINTFINCNIHC